MHAYVRCKRCDHKLVVADTPNNVTRRVDIPAVFKTVKRCYCHHKATYTRDDIHMETEIGNYWPLVDVVIIAVFAVLFSLSQQGVGLGVLAACIWTVREDGIVDEMLDRWVNTEEVK